MTKYFIEVDIADADDNTAHRLEQYLDHGTFRDGVGDAGMDVKTVRVLPGPATGQVPPEPEKKDYIVYADVTMWMQVEATSIAEAAELALMPDRKSDWQPCEENEIGPNALDDIVTIELDGPEVIPHAETFGEFAKTWNEKIDEIARDTCGTLVAIPPQIDNWEAFDRISILINAIRDVRTKYLK